MTPQLGFLDIGAPELVVVLLILLLLFGSKKLPELSRSLGQSAHELRKGLSGPVDNGQNKNVKEENPSPQGNNTSA